MLAFPNDYSNIVGPPLIAALKQHGDAADSIVKVRLQYMLDVAMTERKTVYSLPVNKEYKSSVMRRTCRSIISSMAYLVHDESIRDGLVNDE